jgi:hypothetical protein
MRRARSSGAKRLKTIADFEAEVARLECGGRRLGLAASDVGALLVAAPWATSRERLAAQDLVCRLALIDLRPRPAKNNRPTGGTDRRTRRS